MLIIDAISLINKKLDDTIVEEEVIPDTMEVEAVEKRIIEGKRVPKTDRCSKCGNKKNSLDPWDICLCKFNDQDLPAFKESRRIKGLINKTYKQWNKINSGEKKKPIIFGMK